MRAVIAKDVLKSGVDCLDIRGGVEAEGDAALVGDDDYTQACMIEAGDGFGDAGEDMEVGSGM